MVVRSPHSPHTTQAAALTSEAAGDDSLQLDAAQLAEYRRLQGEAQSKGSRLLQERAALEAQLKVRWQQRHWWKQ